MGSTEKLDSTDEVKERKSCFSGVGVLYAILSSIFYCGNSSVVKMLNLHPTQISFSRCCIQFLILLPIVQKKYKTVDVLGPKKFRFLLFMRSAVGASAGIILYISISLLSVGNAIAIHFLSMIIVPFAAWIFLKERATVFDVIFALVSLCGIVLIAKPTFLFRDQNVEDITSLSGVLLGLLSAMLLAATMCMLRKLGPVVYPPLILLYYSSCGCLISMTVLFATGEYRLPCWHELPLLLLVGCLGLLAQLFLTIALKTERAGTVSILGSTEIIFVYIVQALVLQDIPSVLSLIGASLILSCSIGIGIRKLIIERKKGKPQQVDSS